MKKATLIVIGCLGSALMSCKNNPQPAETSSIKPNESSQTIVSSVLTPNDFPEYRDVFKNTTTVFYWKDSNGELMCGLASSSGSSALPPSADYFQKMQNESPCPVYVMGQIANEYYSSRPDEEKRNPVFEVAYPTIGEAWSELAAFAYPKLPSRNVSIYETLGIKESYENYYGASKQVYFSNHDLLETNEPSVFRYLPKYFTNLSPIYRWIDDSNNTRYGFGPQKQDTGVMAEGPMEYMQNYCNCSPEEIKKIIAAYYASAKVPAENPIIEIPTIRNMDTWKNEVSDVYPRNISQDIALYQELGIEEAYNSLFLK